MRSVVASHGPGSNPRGPNQTLEEFRPAVTTSPETRRSIAGAAAGRRPPSTKSRAPQGAHAAATSVALHRCRAPITCAAGRRPLGRSAMSCVTSSIGVEQQRPTSSRSAAATMRDHRATGRARSALDDRAAAREAARMYRPARN
ncbi:hypothetical protein F511_13869 [Dorcoceras hygrometricum]|uniref:Uncharacterized protein n=1 Tax=Dorcoceras hygrometricum TaxID=472368 RepID=A0A2Z7B7T4_9LAMI|nr:hypothetical protein F511_13869 [Dorcoceras hygrometricum]